MVRVRLRCGGIGKEWKPARYYEWRWRFIVEDRFGRSVRSLRPGEEPNHPGDIVGFVMPRDFGLPEDMDEIDSVDIS